jgi:microcystin-dependent protein
MSAKYLTKTVCATIVLLLVGVCSSQPVSADPFIGEIRWVSFGFAPRGWASCNGQFLPINQNQALFALLGTTFGGNGQTTFALPDMRSRAPIHVSPEFSLGGSGGEESHVLTMSELSSHTHDIKVDPKEGTSALPTNNYPAKSSGGTSAYGSTPNAAMIAGAVAVQGGQPHENMKPFITLNCIIALQGIFPSQN